MNVENINKVADAIEAAVKAKKGLRGVGFNMADWATDRTRIVSDHVNSCGTVACMAGWAYLIQHPRTTAERLKELSDPGWDDSIFENRIPREARNYLELSDEVATALFVPEFMAHDEIEPLHAVAVLRHLAKTGKVDWTQGASTHA